ncbi:MAG: cation diffusion facilitator family transporter [Jatrophihabitans sp.]|uniref:cation diffusion facilitator family transporter n=1 Tax=Jatrophihabitans sp. TaxID=1932789 RepID=UPI003F822480
MGHDHAHHAPRPATRDGQRWLLAALGVIVAFMIGEVVAGLLAHSLALLADAGHMLTDAAALLVAVIAARIADRPARGAYTYGFTRVDALSGQANGITLLLLAVWFTVEGIRRLVYPGAVTGGVVAVVAVVGVVVNLAATWLAGHADRASLNIRGAIAHLVTDLWAFLATLVAGIVVLTTGWTRADPIASLCVAALMAWTGAQLVREAGRVFLEAAPTGFDPGSLGGQLARLDGVAQVHDLHVWQLGPHDLAMSAHVLVTPPYDCHEVAGRMRALLGDEHGIDHVTLQVDHLDAVGDTEHCSDAHGGTHLSPELAPERHA